MAIVTTPPTAADIDKKWQELVDSGKFTRGSERAGGYVDKATGQWYAGDKGPDKTMRRAGKWDALIKGGKYKPGSARAGGYVEVATGKWFSPNSKPPGQEEEDEGGDETDAQ